MIRRAAPLAVIIAAAACTSATDQGDQLPGRGEFIVYSLSASAIDDRQMFRIRPDGTQKLAMTDPVNRTNDSPTFNSDGNTVLFLSSRDFSVPPAFVSRTLRMLYKTSIDATVQSRVTANPPAACKEGEGHFSADDKMIAFILTCHDSTTPVPGTSLVYRINADGSGQTRVVSDHPALAAPHGETFAAFTPAGRIVFAVDFGSVDAEFNSLNVDLFVMDADGKNTQRLTNLAAEGRTINDRITIVGNSVYFVTLDMNALNNGRLEAIGVDGTGRTVVYPIPDISFAGGHPLPQDSQFTVSKGRMAFVRQLLPSGQKMLMTAALDGTGAMPIDSSAVPWTPSWK